MNQLTNLEVEEVSMVDAGANPEAQVVLFKRKEKNVMDQQAENKLPEPDATTVDKSEFAGLTSKIEKLAERVEERLEKLEDAEWLKKTEKYALLGEDPAELAKMFKSVSKTNPELYGKAVKAFDSALAALQKAGTFEEIGKTGSGGAPTIEKVAAEIRKQHPELTRRQAIDRAYQEHPELQF